MSTALDRIAQIARESPKCQFTSLAHLLTPEFLMESWVQVNRRGASGIDGERPSDFERNLQERCESLVDRLKRNAYQAPPVKRVNIPKGDGKTRPLGIPTSEDRLLQRAVMRILEAIYEQDFLDCSHGFRPKRSPHTALHELRNQCMAGRVRAVFETDIQGFFNHLSHKWLMKMLQVRIGDTVILRLIGKWLKAGALIDGIVTQTNEGTPQGGPISPLLANIYLHYVLDLWFQKKMVPFFKGKAYLTRFADDFVAAFEHRREAEFFAIAVKERLRDFGLELAEEKTGLHPFGRMPTLFKEETGSFDFLGFSHHSRTNREGKYVVVRIPTVKSRRKFLEKTKSWLTTFRHANRKEQREALTSRLLGFYRYFGLRHCLRQLSKIRFEVMGQWQKALSKQGQRSKAGWQHLLQQPWFKLPFPKLYQPLV